MDLVSRIVFIAALMLLGAIVPISAEAGERVSYSVGGNDYQDISRRPLVRPRVSLS